MVFPKSYAVWSPPPPLQVPIWLSIPEIHIALPTVFDKPLSVTVLFAASVVNAPVEGVVAPIAVPLMPVFVVLKLLDVIVRAFAPVLIDEAANPERASAP